MNSSIGLSFAYNCPCMNRLKYPIEAGINTKCFDQLG